jgi:argininosuccinate lyase
MKAALTMDMLATDLADYLVRKGVSVRTVRRPPPWISDSASLCFCLQVPFRETHHISGRAVALAEKLSIPLSDLTFDQFKTLSDKFDPAVDAVCDYENSVERRNLLGGPSKKGIERQVEVLRKGVETM